MPDFADHFSTDSAGYAKYRPSYPEALFTWLAESVPDASAALVWDNATGTGQAAVALAEHFPRVIATDASAAQIARAQRHPRVRYAVRPAHDSGLEAGSVALVTVAQALHWFDLPAFTAEVERVAAPGALVAAWTYGPFTVNAPVDAALEGFREQVAPFWPPQRAHVDARYATLPWPWPRISATARPTPRPKTSFLRSFPNPTVGFVSSGFPEPEIPMQASWTVEQLLGYLRTWSATRRASKTIHSDPLTPFEPAIRRAWGDPSPRVVRWPLTVLASRL